MGAKHYGGRDGWAGVDLRDFGIFAGFTPIVFGVGVVAETEN